MKKLTLIIGLGIALTGCRDDDFKWINNCDCGIITDVELVDDYYYVEAENNCTNNLNTFRIKWSDLPKPVAGRGRCFDYSW